LGNWGGKEGLEPISASGCGDKELRQSPQASGAKCGAKCGALGAADAKLAEIFEALPHMPPPAIEIIFQTFQTVRAFRD
jgi:hypothetical protein